MGHSARGRRAPAGLVALVGVGTIAPAHAPARSELRYRYVANRSAGSVSFPYVEGHLGATGESWSVDGVIFAAEGSEFVLTVDDAAMVWPLTVPVLVIDTDRDGQRRFRTQCVDNHQPVTFDVSSPGAEVGVFVYNHTEAPWAGCRLGAAGTTGTLAIVP